MHLEHCVVILLLILHCHGFETVQRVDDVTTPEPEGSGFTNEPTTTPQPSCPSSDVIVNIDEVNQDCTAEMCNGTCTINITLAEGHDGEVFASPDVCSNECSRLAGVPIVIATCNGSDWSITITNCTTSIADIEDPGEQATVTVIVATNPNITSDQVDDVITVVHNGSNVENIAQDVTDDYLLSINGLLVTATGSENEVAASTIEGQAAMLSDTIDNILTNVELSQPYVQSLDQVAVAAIEPTVSNTNISFRTTDRLEEFTIETESEATEATNQISFTTSNRVGFKSLADDLLYPTAAVKATSVTGKFFNSIIMGIQSDDVSNENLVKMKFKMNKTYGLDANGKYIEGVGTPSCLVWQTNAWANTGCKVNPVYDVKSDSVTCQCSVAGDVIVEFIYTKEEIPKSGLSGGAIAGIVIGSVAFVAIVAGLGIYCYKKKQNNKNKVEVFQLETANDTRPKSRDI